MHTYLDCVPCFLRQVLDAARLVTTDESIHESVVRATLDKVREMDLSQPPPAMARFIHQAIRNITGRRDPYLEIKRLSNEFALSLYPELKNTVKSSANGFETAVRLAIAGNIIDFGIHSAKVELDEGQILGSIQNSLSANLYTSLISELKQECADANNILYLADNAGEIVFDRILIEEMPTQKIIVAVKGHPIINDATIEDAESTGISSLVKVIENGSDAPGTILTLCSDEFLKIFHDADLVIAKGQGNYETLSAVRKNIFFLFKAKCPVIAKHVGASIGSVIIARNST